MRKILPPFLIAATLVLSPFFSLIKAQQPKITAAMIADIQSVREVKVSPDGTKIAYTFRIPGGEDDSPGKSWSEIMVMDYNGKNKQRYVVKPSSGWNIRWSPDSKSLYFLASRKANDAHTQIYRIALAGGEAEMVSSHDQSIRTFELSPDGSQVAFTSRDGLTAMEKQNKTKGRDWIVYGQGYHFTRLHTMDLASGQIRKTFGKDLEVSTFVWTPNGKELVFRAAETPETDDGYMFQKIYKVLVSGEEPKVVCKTAGKLGPLSVSPDGKTLAWCGAVDISDPLPQSLFTAPLDGGSAPRNHSQNLEASVNSFHWLNDQEMLVKLDEGVYANIYRLAIGNGKMTPVMKEGPILYSVSADANFRHFAAAGNSPQNPTEVYAWSLEDNAIRRLTFSNPDIEQVQMGKQEVIEWKGPGGMRIEGILTYPVGYKKGTKYPLLLQIHGGPEGVSQHGWNTRSVYPVQLYAANGFFVLEPNYRGSKGRGVAFSKADHKDLAGKEFDDVLAGIDELAKRNLIDPEKVGTGGFSYGGYFSAWAATKHSDRFKAAMVGAGITNWISFTGTTDILQENSLVHWNLWWYDDMKLVWDRSPLAHINNAKTPTLIVHGEKDVRVPPGQGIEMYNALKIREVPTNLVIYKRQPHGIREWSAQVDYMNRTLDWFKKYVK